MADREEPDQPRKRIAVACGRCRKRKIRCSGDPGNGGPCSNCKNAAYEPCLFLRVSSQETPLKETNDYPYNIDAARAYAHQSRGPVSPLSPVPQYAHDIVAGDGLATYRQNPYSYSSKGYYPNMSGWTGAYQDDGGVDYSLNYSSYQIMNQEPTPLVSGYGPYTGRKSVYVDPEASTYAYGNLIHRPAVSNESQGFSLSSIAASLPSASDRLHSSVNRTLTSPSSYRSEGIPGPYGNGKAPSAGAIPEVAYSNLQPSFESTYPTTSALASAIAHRATAHADATYPTGAAVTTTAAATTTTAAAAVMTADQLYNAGDPSMRSAEDGGAGLSYVYGDGKLGGPRRDSHSSGGIGAGSLLSNGHVYVPESHSAHPAPHAYVVPASASSSSQGRGMDGATTPGSVSGSGPAGVVGRGGAHGGSNNNSNSSSSSSVNISIGMSSSGSGNGGGTGCGSGSSHRPSDSHRRSAGSLRGG